MDQTNAHQAMQERLDTLLGRITALNKTIITADGIRKIEAQTQLADLEHRHAKLAGQLQALSGDGVWQNVKAELELMADDLSNSVDAMTTGMAMLQEPPPKLAGKSS